jgi:RHS repeat-associated protein
MVPLPGEALMNACVHAGSFLNPGRWLGKFRALLRRWSRFGRSEDAASLAARARFHPECVSLEDRFHPNDPLGLMHAAFWGAGTGLLLADVALTGSPTDAGLAIVPGAESSASTTPVAAPQEPFASTVTTSSATNVGLSTSVTTMDSTASATSTPSAPAPSDAWPNLLAGLWSPALDTPPPPRAAGDTAPTAHMPLGSTDPSIGPAPASPVETTATPLVSPAASAPTPLLPLMSSAAVPASAAPAGPVSQGMVSSTANGPLLSASGISEPAASATSSTTPASPPVQASAHPTLTQGFAQLPLAFEANVGQTDPQVRYLSRGPGYSLFLTDHAAVLSLTRPGNSHQGDVLQMQFTGTSPDAQVVGQQELTSRSNYFTGQDPTAWQTDVTQYAQVATHNLYPGIDAVYYGNSQRQLEYDLVVAPGADPSAIHLSLQGAQGLHLDDQGNLLVQTGGGTLVEQTPTLYQTHNGVRQPVTGRYTLGADCTLGFQAQGYDPSQPLTIDPVLSYGSYLGGSGTDQGYGVAVDAAGNLYLTGATASSNFPTTAGPSYAGNIDAFVAKLNAAGNQLLYATYLGGSQEDDGYGLAVDAAGNAYVAGFTMSSDFPVTASAYQSTGGSSSAFLAKLNVTGDAVLYASYLGSGLDTTALGVAVDAAGNAYLTGTAQPSGVGSFPTTSGAYQTSGHGGEEAFVSKFNPNASGSSSLVYSTLLGGSADDHGRGIAVDSAGDAFVTGSTGNPSGTAFPTTTGAYQTSFGSGTTKGFVTEVNPSGTALVYSTLLGGTGTDLGNAIALNNAGNAYVTGTATSTNFPTTTGAYQTSSGGNQDAVVTELNTAGTGLVYSTYLGGSSADQGFGIAVDGNGDAVVVGETASTNFPTSNALQSSNGGGNDGFLTRLNSSGTGLSYSTYLGGSSDDAAQAIALDASNTAYVSGWTSSSNFPTGPGPYQGSNAGGTDAFVARIGDIPNAPVFTGISSDTGSSSSDQITTDTTLTLSGTAAKSATVTVSRAGVGVLGSVTANATTGAWTYDYTGTTLPEDTYAFTATATASSLTSAPSAPFLVAVDLTAPAVTLTASSSTTSLGPQLLVTGSDLNGLPDGTTVSIDVDLNNNGNFTDSGESSYASGTLKDGSATITLPALSSTGTYPMRARVTDLAGTQGTSSTQTVVVTSQTSWSVASAGVPTSDPLTGDALDQLGNVTLRVPFDLDQSPGTSQAGNPALVYNSDSLSNVQTVVQATVQTPNNAALPGSIAVQLTWDGVAQTAQTFYPATGTAAGSLLTMGVQAPTVSSTSRHGWSLAITPSGGSTLTVSGSTFVVDQDGSPFGAAWTFAPVDQLVSIAADSYGPAGMLRLYGSGGWRFYASAGGGSYTSPAGDNGTLSYASSAYTYTTPNGQTWNFNSSGQETSWVSADGQQTLAYRYTGSQLTGMTAIDGGVTTFTYSSGLLHTLQTVNNRTTTFTYTGSDLTTVTNPDGGLHTFTYDGSHHPTDDKLANVEHGWSYAAANTLATYTLGSTGSLGGGSPTVTAVNPVVMQGLANGLSNTLVVGSARATVTDALGHTTSRQLDSQGRPLQEIQPDGGTWQWTRDSNGRVTVQTDPLQRVTSYQYDSSGYVTQETLPDNSTLSYTYQSAFHARTKAVDQRGDVTTYTYDSSGHPVTQVDALNETTTYGWTTTGLLQTITDPLNHTTTFTYDSTTRRLTAVTDALNHSTSYSYDSNGNPLTTTDARNRVTTTTYDAMGRLTQTTDASGHTVTATYNAASLELGSTDPLGRISNFAYDGYNRGLSASSANAVGTPAQSDTMSSYNAVGLLSAPRNSDGYSSTYGYDSMGRVNQVTDPLGGVQRMVYDLDGEKTASRDQLGRWAFYQYNNRGDMTAVTDALGNTTSMTYDAAGNRTRVSDPLHHTTTFQYDALNRLTVQTDALSHSVTTTYDAAGNVRTVTDQLGSVTSFTYDAANRRTSEMDAVGTAVQRTLTTSYDVVNNVLATTDGLGHSVTFTYDALNRQTAITDALNHTVTTSYDAAGNVIAIQDALSKTTSFGYDALNHRVSTTDPLNHTATVAWDALGNAVASTNALGDTSIAGYDALGRAVVSVDARGGVTRTGYDAVGNQMSVTDPDGNKTSFVLDGLNRVVKQIDPLNNTSTMGYDAASRLTSETDRNGRVQNFSYDAANRELGGTWVTGGTTVNTLTFTYDAEGNPLTAADGAGAITMTYDALRRLQDETNVFGLTLTYTYDARDRVTQVQDALGGTTTSVYDAANRLTSRQVGGSGVTPLRIDLGYDNRNDLTSLTRYSDLTGTQVVGTTVYSFDDANRVTSIVNKNAGNTTLSYYNYSYDGANRVTSQTWQSGSTPGSATYTYDKTNQLLTDSTATYSYDQNGNRTMSGYQTGAENRLTTDGVWTYTYDAAGNEIQKSKGSGLEAWYFSYDTRNHLTTVRQTSDGSTNQLLVTYTYDVLGDRVQQTKWQPSPGTVTTRFDYDGQNVWADTDSSNTLQVRYLRGDAVDQSFARTEASGQANPGVAWYLTDRQGSVRDLSDSSGTLRDHLDYDGYGNVTESNSSYGDRYKYTGREFDSNTGLQYNRARYLDSKSGRWMSQDPLAFAAGDSNIYRYVNNNPGNSIDPSGKDNFWLTDPHLGFGYLGSGLWSDLGTVLGGTPAQTPTPAPAPPTQHVPQPGNPEYIHIPGAIPDDLPQDYGPSGPPHVNQPPVYGSTHSWDQAFEQWLNSLFDGIAGSCIGPNNEYQGIPKPPPGEAHILVWGPWRTALSEWDHGDYCDAVGHCIQAGGQIAGWVDAAAGALNPDPANVGATQPDQLYHGSDVPPDTIFSEGLKPSGTNMDLDAYLAGNYPDGGYVSATTTVEDAAPFAQEGGWVYEFDNPGDGIDITEYNASQGHPYGPYGNEAEYAFPHPIDPSTITGAHEIGPNEIPTGNFVPNPNYQLR